MKKLYHSKCSCSHGEYTLPPVSVANNTHTHTLTHARTGDVVNMAETGSLSISQSFLTF